MLFAFHELATNAAAVLVTYLVNLDGIVTAVERENESAALIIRLSGHEFAVESQDVHVLLESLLHVELGWLWLKSNHTAHRVFLGTVAHVGWDLLVNEVCFAAFNCDGSLIVA